MFRSIRTVLAIALGMFPLSASATPIYDLVLTYQSTTVTLTLTGDVKIPVSNFAPVYVYNAGPGTINGVGSYTILSALTPQERAGNLFGTFSSSLSDLGEQTFAYSGSGTLGVYLSGTIPAVYAPGPTGGLLSPAYWVYNYVPGTYNFVDYSFVTGEPSQSAATLTITQEVASPVPELSTLLLLATGGLGIVLLLVRNGRFKPETAHTIVC